MKIFIALLGLLIPAQNSWAKADLSDYIKIRFDGGKAPKNARKLVLQTKYSTSVNKVMKGAFGRPPANWNITVNNIHWINEDEKNPLSFKVVGMEVQTRGGKKISIPLKTKTIQLNPGKSRAAVYKATIKEPAPANIGKTVFIDLLVKVKNRLAKVSLAAELTRAARRVIVEECMRPHYWGWQN